MEYVIFSLELLTRLRFGLHFLPVHIGKVLIICSWYNCGGIFDLCFAFIPLFALLIFLFAVIIKLLVLLVAVISMACVFLIG